MSQEDDTFWKTMEVEREAWIKARDDVRVKAINLAAKTLLSASEEPQQVDVRWTEEHVGSSPYENRRKVRIWIGNTLITIDAPIKDFG